MIRPFLPPIRGRERARGGGEGVGKDGLEQAPEEEWRRAAVDGGGRGEGPVDVVRDLGGQNCRGKGRGPVDGDEELVTRRARK